MFRDVEIQEKSWKNANDSELVTSSVAFYFIEFASVDLTTVNRMEGPVEKEIQAPLRSDFFAAADDDFYKLRKELNDAGNLEWVFCYTYAFY